MGVPNVGMDLLLHRLPNRLRKHLSKPWGELIPQEKIDREEILGHIEGASMIVSVGDATTEMLLSLGITPDVQVVDARERRHDRESPRKGHKTELQTQNPAGYLSEDALKTVSEALKIEKPVRIIVDGEEDLLTIPIIATYPPKTRVLYGQPGIGLVIVNALTKANMASKVLKEMGINIAQTQTFQPSIS